MCSSKYYFSMIEDRCGQQHSYIYIRNLDIVPV